LISILQISLIAEFQRLSCLQVFPVAWHLGILSGPLGQRCVLLRDKETLRLVKEFKSNT